MKTIMNKTLKFIKNQRGLTLIELLAIIVVLGIIAAIAVPSFGTVIGDSQTKADAQTVKLLESASLLYLTQTDLQTGGVMLMSRVVSAGYLTAVPVSQVNTANSFHSATVTYSAGVYGVTVAAAAAPVETFPLD